MTLLLGLVPKFARPAFAKLLHFECFNSVASCALLYQCLYFQIFCPRISGKERTQDVYPSFLPRLIGVRDELTESRSIQEEPTFNPSLVGIGGSVGRRWIADGRQALLDTQYCGAGAHFRSNESGEAIKQPGVQKREHRVSF